MTRRKVQAMRLILSTDYSAEKDAECIGSFSGDFMIEDPADIVDVDWSVPGEVQVTLVIPSTRG